MDWSNILVSAVTPDVLGQILGADTAVGIVENGLVLTGRKDVITATIIGETKYIVNEDDQIYTAQAENRMVIFSGKTGETGQPGRAATVAVGTVTTLPAGSSATVVNSGTAEDAVFDFGIPRGDQGSGSVVYWGDITGTLADQTDLQSALDDKADTSSLGTLSAVNDAPSNNKIYGRQNGGWAEVSGGGGGSASWGSISGTLSDQTDLQNVLNAKAFSESITEEFSSSKSYPSGWNYAYYNGILYKFYGPYQGPFSGLVNYAPVTVFELLALKAPLDSPALTGTPTAPTAASGTDTTQIATTAFVQGEISGKADTADLGNLAYQDTVDYSTEVTNKPSLGTMAGINDAPSDGKEYARKDGAWAEVSGGISGVVWGDITGTLSNQTDLQDALDAKADTADLGDLAYEDSVDYTDVTNTPTLGNLASQDTVDYATEVTNKPTLGALASQDTVDYTTEVTNKPTLGTMAAVNDAPSDGEEYVRKNGSWAVSSGITGVDWGDIGGTLADQTDLQDALDAKADTADLGALATQDTVDYSTEVTNKPTLGSLASKDDAPSDDTYYLRRNGAWTDADGRYYTETEIDTSLALKAPLASPALTGTPTAPTATVSDDSTQIATTAFVQDHAPIHLSVTASAGSTVTKSDARITSTMRVYNIIYDTPKSVRSGISWTTSSGSVTFTATFADSTTIDFDLMEFN